MSDIDQIAAAKATLELVIQEFEETADNFRAVLEKLDAIENLPPGIKAVQFRQLEQSGAFKFRGADIRHFSKTAKRALTPPQFVKRTQRRLSNTNSLIAAFMNHAEFEGGKDLSNSIAELLNQDVIESENKSVLGFRDQVEELRQSGLFQRYMDIRKNYLRNNEDLRNEADYLASKETVADGIMVAEGVGEELKEIQSEMEAGEISADEAMDRLGTITGEEGEGEDAGAEAAEEPDTLSEAEDTLGRLDALGADEDDAAAAEAKTEGE